MVVVGGGVSDRGLQYAYSMPFNKPIYDTHLWLEDSPGSKALGWAIVSQLLFQGETRHLGCTVLPAGLIMASVPPTAALGFH